MTGLLSAQAPDPVASVRQSGRGTASDLLAFQRLAWESVTISATRKCPLRCTHCITRSAPEAPGPIFSPEQATLWARDLEEMAQQGLRHVTFTGGEPILALDALEVFSKVAAAAGINCYVVTSCVWARSPESARRIFARLPYVRRWDLGADGYHAAEMPLERVRYALDAVLDAGGDATIRACESPNPDETARFLEALDRIAGGRAPVISQSVRAIGRAEDAAPKQRAEVSAGAPRLPRRPCVSTGLFIRADGTTGPCCAGLAYEAAELSPFHYGVVEGRGDLLAAWVNWRHDPLLRVMRLAGLIALEGWLPTCAASGPEDPCEACVALWRSLGRDQAQALRRRAETGTVKRTLDALEVELYGSLWGDDVA